VTPRLVLAVATLVLAAGAAPPPGALSCAGCHAEAGRPETGFPVLQGRPAAEVLAALRDFRAGERPATVMDRIARGFSDDELQAIAAWIAAPR
jgi:cytochrome subunit of sulfide dehydrogenase